MQVNSARLSAYSTIELLVAITIVGIISGVSIPNFSAAIAKNEVKAQSMLLAASLRVARNSAVTSQRNVHVCAMSLENSLHCQARRGYNSNWSKGWHVFLDNNGNNELDEADELIQSRYNEGNSKLVFNQRGRLRFFPDGSARSAGFYLCDRAGKALIHLKLLHSGRTKSQAEMSDKHKSICMATEPIKKPGNS